MVITICLTIVTIAMDMIVLSGSTATWHSSCGRTGLTGKSMWWRLLSTVVPPLSHKLVYNPY